MSFLRKSLTLAAAALAVGTLLVSAASVSAHERRAVGEFSFVVGWLNEPALLNQPNGVDLRVSRTSDASPVTGLEQSLKVEVTADGKTTEVQMRPRFNTPGAYDGRLTPTATGAYSFKITGTIEGQSVDETFTAGAGTFALIEVGEGFPNPVLTVQDLEDRIAALEAAGTSAGNDDDDSDGGSSNALGIAGVVLGALGLGAGGFALTRKS